MWDSEPALYFLPKLKGRNCYTLQCKDTICGINAVGLTLIKRPYLQHALTVVRF